MQVSGTVRFIPHVPGGPVNRLTIASYDLSGVQDADWALSGGNLCDIGELVLPTVQSFLIDALASEFTGLALCGAPGAPLFVQCP